MAYGEIAGIIDLALDKAGKLAGTIHTVNDTKRLKEKLLERLTKTKSVADFIIAKVNHLSSTDLSPQHEKAAKDFSRCMASIQDTLGRINDASRADRWVKEPKTYAQLYNDLLSTLRREFREFCGIYVATLKSKNLITDTEKASVIDAYFQDCGDNQTAHEIINILEDMHSGITEKLALESAKKGDDVSGEVEELRQYLKNIEPSLMQLKSMPLPPVVMMKGSSHAEHVCIGSEIGTKNMTGTVDSIVTYDKAMVSAGTKINADLMTQYQNIINNMPISDRTALEMSENATAKHMRVGNSIATENRIFQDGEPKPPSTLTQEQSMIIVVHTIQSSWVPTLGQAIALEPPFEHSWTIPKQNKWAFEKTSALMQAYESFDGADKYQQVKSFNDTWAALTWLKNSSLPEDHHKKLEQHYEIETAKPSAALPPPHT